MMPKYPVYIPSKGRADDMMTANMFDKYHVPYRVVVQPDQVEAYAKWKDRLLVLPEDGKGLVYARNWIKDHSIAEGHERHWQFDDDIKYMLRVVRGDRVPIAANDALALAEEFTDRYENVAISSFNSAFFVPSRYGLTDTPNQPPFYLNVRCYTCFLINNVLANRWRNRYNEDTDMTLQALADGWCTILFNAFLIWTVNTMTHKGGQTSIYVNDGRLRMADQLKTMWPGTVDITRRHGRPQHIIEHDWRRFTTKLKRKEDVVIPTDDSHRGLTLKPVAQKGIDHERAKALLGEFGRGNVDVATLPAVNSLANKIKPKEDAK